jgi:tetratricopeptide (TPR) repeat protein
MSRFALSVILSLCLGGWSTAQQDTTQPADQGPGKKSPSSERNKEAGESSSRDTKIDLSPPKDDTKSHPYSRSSVSEAATDATSDVQEFHPWDPHKAAKDIEVGDFYFKRKNYRAALDRYREALYYKSNDALANFHMGQCLEKLDNPEEAAVHYQEYLKILPQGPLSQEAQKALDRLKDKTAAADSGKK